MALRVKADTGLMDHQTPCIYKSVWNGNKMQALYIAENPETLLFMPVAEASAWALNKHDGVLKNAKVYAQSGSKPAEIECPTVHFKLYGTKERSLKDKTFYLSLDQLRFDKSTEGTNHKLLVIAQRALRPATIKWRV